MANTEFKTKKTLHILHWVKNRNLAASGPDMIQYRDSTQISENISLWWQETYWYQLEYNFYQWKMKFQTKHL